MLKSLKFSIIVKKDALYQNFKHNMIGNPVKL